MPRPAMFGSTAKTPARKTPGPAACWHLSLAGVGTRQSPSSPKARRSVRSRNSGAGIAASRLTCATRTAASPPACSGSSGRGTPMTSSAAHGPGAAAASWRDTRPDGEAICPCCLDFSRILRCQDGRFASACTCSSRRHATHRGGAERLGPGATFDTEPPSLRVQNDQPWSDHGEVAPRPHSHGRRCRTKVSQI